MDEWKPRPRGRWRRPRPAQWCHPTRRPVACRRGSTRTSARCRCTWADTHPVSSSTWPVFVSETTRIQYTQLIPVRGLTLIHSLAQPEPFFVTETVKYTHRIPQKVLMSSWKVDECEPMPPYPSSVATSRPVSASHTPTRALPHKCSFQLNSRYFVVVPCTTRLWLAPGCGARSRSPAPGPRAARASALRATTTP